MSPQAAKVKTYRKVRNNRRQRYLLNQALAPGSGPALEHVSRTNFYEFSFAL